MNIKDLAQSKYFRAIAVTAGVLVVALLSFASGVAVGIHKAKFSYAWGQNYERNFVGGPRGMMSGDQNRGMMGRFGLDERSDGRNFRNAHGIAGKVLSVSGDFNLIITDKENNENTVSVTDSTILKRNGVDIKYVDIVKGDNAVVIGKPGDNGVITADFIRFFGTDTTNNQ